MIEPLLGHGAHRVEMPNATTVPNDGNFSVKEDL